MNYYERVQRAIDYVEENLKRDISLQEVAQAAYMSLPGLYRMFFALTGYTLKDYIRRSRISEASKVLSSQRTSILEIAMDYGFESQEAFSRAFKQLTGHTPGGFRKSKANYLFERVNVLDQYFEIQDQELLEKYPNIKVLKELEPMRVAYYRHISRSPEQDALAVILPWAKKAGLDKEGSKARFFGYNNPNPPPDFVPGETEYGYELMVTIDEDLVVDDPLVKDKFFEGGFYAVSSISHASGEDIMKAWKRFNQWLGPSKYMAGTHQWLEELLAFDESNMRVDLYMPIMKMDKNAFFNSLKFESVSPFKIAYYRVNGDTPWQEIWNVMLAWADKNGYFASGKERRFIYYSSVPKKYPGSPGFWSEVAMEIGEDEVIKDPKIQVKQFKGGFYAVSETPAHNVEQQWSLLEKWTFSNNQYTFSGHQWFQEHRLANASLSLDAPARCCFAIKKS